MTNRQTDTHTHTHRPCYSVHSNRLHLAIAAMQPNGFIVNSLLSHGGVYVECGLWKLGTRLVQAQINCFTVAQYQCTSLLYQYITAKSLIWFYMLVD